MGRQHPTAVTTGQTWHVPRQAGGQGGVEVRRHRPQQHATEDTSGIVVVPAQGGMNGISLNDNKHTNG